MNEPYGGAPQRSCENDVAPFVLGALEPGEAQAFADHMRICDACRGEVAALMPVLDVLGSCAPRYEVGAALRRRVMHAVRFEPKASSAAAGRPRRTPRRWRARAPLALPRIVAVAATAVLALAVVLGVTIAARSGGSPARVIQASVGGARVEVVGNHGELIVEDLPRPPLDRIYELWLRHGAAPPAPTTLFTVTSRGTAELGLPGALTGVTGVLVTLEPIGGSRAPTTRPVIVARLV